jgi:hypothetical protein
LKSGRLDYLQAVVRSGVRLHGASDRSLQTIRTDQQIPIRAASVFELDPYPILRTDRPDQTGIASYAIAGKAFQ